MVEIGTTIKELRQAKRMSQKELAEHLHVTPQAVSKWELGKSYPDLDTLLQLSDFFHISTDKLLGNASPSFLEALFSKKGNRTMKKNAPESKPEYPKGPVPKAIKVENAANYLMITFDNGETRYLRSHYLDDYLDAYSLKKGRGKRRLLIGGGPATMWLGTEIEILNDGTVLLFGKDRYSPQELWYESRSRAIDLSE